MTDSVFFLFWDPYSPTLTKEGVWGCSLQQTAKEVESARQFSYHQWVEQFSYKDRE